MQLVLPATSAFGKEDNGRRPFRPYIQHLAANNVSAGRVVTRMAFDTKSPTPKVMFSPDSATPDDVLQIIAQQAKSPAAEAAIKMSVFQADTSTEAPADDGGFENVLPKEAEPIKRESKPAANADAEKNVVDVMKKWSKK
jgi:hypothetical protein